MNEQAVWMELQAAYIKEMPGTEETATKTNNSSA